MTIIDPLGRAVRTLVIAWRPAGQFREVWDGCDEQGRPVASGVYICRLECDRAIMQCKLIRLRQQPGICTAHLWHCRQAAPLAEN